MLMKSFVNVWCNEEHHVTSPNINLISAVYLKSLDYYTLLLILENKSYEAI